MGRKENILTRVLRSLLCILLSIAIALSLFVPGFDLHKVMPDNPVEDTGIQEITVLKVGETTDNITSIVVPVGGETSEEDDTKNTENPDSTGKKTETDKKSEEQEKEEPQKPDTGDGEQGQDDGNQGEEGGEFADLDIAMVMTWYKYGNEPRTITCVPAGTVSKDLNISQLKNNMLKFDFAPYGEEAEYLEITAVSVFKPQKKESSTKILTLDLFF